MGNPAKQDVLDALLRSYEAYFDVSRDYAYADRQFAGYAELQLQSEQAALAKNSKKQEANAFEYIFFDTADHLDDSWVDEAYRFMTTEAIGKVVPDENHTTSCISLVAVVNSADDKTLAKIRKTRFRKNYNLGFRGWVDLRMAVVDLASMEVITNGVGKEMKPTLCACLRTMQRTNEKA